MKDIDAPDPARHAKALRDAIALPPSYRQVAPMVDQGNPASLVAHPVMDDEGNVTHTRRFVVTVRELR